ncbi:MAG: TonB-dependent receptor [Steroidobacteraceae bacterium]
MSRKTRRNACKNAAKTHAAGSQHTPLAGNRLALAIRGLSGLALGAMAFSGPLLAADATTAADTSSASGKSDDSLSEIVVTGIKASLQKSLDIKQESIGVVDAISAEDIGTFPDSDLAAALQRIPGVSVSRGTTSMGGVPTSTGAATEITVRGFGPAFNETLLDGRPMASGTTAQGFDFSSVGADFVSQVDILKTPDFALSSGAIGATVNILYPKPFDHPGLHLAGSVSGSDSPDAGQITPNGGVLFSDTFANDTFGILADAAYSEHKTQANHVNSQGWEGFQLAPSQLAGAPAGASTVGSLPSWFIQDYGIYQEHTTDERKDARLVLQWHPSDDLMITADDNYSSDLLRQTQYGYSVWFNSGSLTNVTRAPDGTLTSWTQPNTPTDFQSQVNGSVIENNEIGVNVAWNVNSHFKTALDVDQSVSKLNPSGQLSSIDSDVGYGNGANGNNVGVAGVGGGALPYLTDYGPNGNAADLLGTGIIGSHVLPISSNQNVETVDQLNLSGEWTEDKLKAKFGFQYIGDNKQLSGYSDFQNDQWQSFSGYGPASNNYASACAGNTPAPPGIACGTQIPQGALLPQNYFTGSFSTGGNFIPGFKNNGKLPPNILQFNANQVLAYLESLGNPLTKYVPGYNYTAQGSMSPPYYAGVYTMAFSPGSYQIINQKTFAPYLVLTQQADIAGMPLTIRTGLRDEEIYLTSSGLGQLPIAITQAAGDHTLLNYTLGPTTLVRNEYNQRYLLPSLDLNLAVTDDLKLRFDASRTLTPPPLADINPVLNIGNSGRIGALNGTGGNPNLQPFSSDNFDFGAEWYYARNSYLSADVFVKEVSDFIVAGTTQQNLNGQIDPTTGKLAVFNITTYVNGPSAQVHGLELGFQQVLGDTGFGVQANGTLVGTNHPYDPNNLTVGQFALPGLADSANVVLFYEKYGFHARIAANWRAGYLDHFGQQQNNSAFGIEPTFVNANTEVDFSSQYDINSHLDVYFEALNINNSTYSTHGRYADQLLDAISFGPTLTFGIHAKL